jgi:hypothetical protein
MLANPEAAAEAADGADADEIALDFSPFHAILRDGADRLMDFLNKDSFTFVVKGSMFASTVAEAILLSPKIHESLSLNPLSAIFTFPDDSVDATEFGHFLTFVRSRDFPRLSHNRAHSFRSICAALGNSRLSAALLSSLCRRNGSSSPRTLSPTTLSARNCFEEAIDE